MVEGKFFPYERFAAWLQDAMTAGKIVMKLMIAAGPECHIVDIEPAERELLAAVYQKEAENHPILGVLAGQLASRSFYPPLSLDQIQAIWNILMEHIVADEQYAAMRKSLTTFLNTHPTSETLLMDIAGCFGPASAPREQWYCVLP